MVIFLFAFIRNSPQKSEFNEETHPTAVIYFFGLFWLYLNQLLNAGRCPIW